MEARRLHHIWTKVRPVRPWYFLAAAALSGVICVAALRANNEHMGQLRQAVYQADKQDGDVQAALTALQHYVTSHMNAGVSGSGANAVYPPIQLKYTYERLRQAALQQANNSDLYTQAQAYCQRLDPVDFSGRNRVPCIEQYVQSHGATPPAISASMYEFDFKAPLWSPDLAGWSLVATVLLGLTGLGTWLGERWLKVRANA